MSPTITGTRAQARFVRMSAKKVRPVLDLVRGEPVMHADEILQFTPREAARQIRKVLQSAVANAVNNDSLPGDELFIAACYADEGPTLKRFRPRARGRATRINKRTCHITVVVDRMDAAELEQLRERQAASGQSGAAAAARRRRVAASRGEEATADDEITDEVAEETTDVIDDPEEQGLLEEAGETVEHAVEAVGEAIEHAVEEVGEAAEAAAAKVGEVVDEAAEKLGEVVGEAAEKLGEVVEAVRGSDETDVDAESDDAESDDDETKKDA